MRIQKLGPISDATINLNKLTVFIGNNGTGKTLAAYSVFAFRNWLQTFSADVIATADFSDLVTNGKLTLPIAETATSVVTNVIESFNRLNESSSYFSNFFRDEAVYVPHKTQITIDKDDFSNELSSKLSKILFSYAGRESDDATDQIKQYAITVEKDATQKNIVITRTEQLSENRKLELSAEENIIKRLNQSITCFFADNLAENIYLPAERIGINVFRTRLNNQVVNESFSNPVEALTSRPAMNERYPYPIEDYIKFLNNSLTSLDRNYDQQTSADEQELLSKLIPGHFFYSEDLNQIRYRLPEDTTQEISFNLVASSLKSLLGIETFVKHHDTFSWLLIDEPEMNLHPTRQAMMADLLYQLTKGNTRVVVSTHSDYFIKALINDILASKVADKEKHIGTTADVSIYEFTNNSVRRLEDLTDEAAFTNFDETTDKINTRYYDLLDQLDEENAGPTDE